MPNSRLVQAALLVASCGGCGVDELPAEDCSVEGQNQFVYELMREVYLWNSHSPALSPLDYASPYEVLEAMRYEELDEWSHITEARARQDLLDGGQFVGLGYLPVRDRKNALRVALVHSDSPAYRAGMRRGMELVAINGRTVQEIDGQQLWWTIEGPNEVGVEVTYTLETVDGEELDLTMEKDVISIRSVLVDEVIEYADKTVGYLLFTGFFGTSNEELRTAFVKFAAEGIDELVLDLRYNSGGYIDTAILLGSLILGPDYAGEPFIRLKYNENLSANNVDKPLISEEPDLQLKRVYVLAGPHTASASELVMNGLEPYLPVESIGYSTHGKPVGSNAWTMCGLAFVPITFQLVNTDDDGDYFDGIPPTCEVPDDLSHELGDPEETQFKQALALMNGEGCFDYQISPSELSVERDLLDPLTARQLLLRPLNVLKEELPGLDEPPSRDED